MSVFGSWNLSGFTANDYIRENADVAVLPKGPDGTRATIFNGLGHAIAATTKHPDAAWKWVEYLSSKEAQEMQATLGVAISAYKGAADTWVDSNKTLLSRIMLTWWIMHRFVHIHKQPSSGKIRLMSY